MTESKRCMKKMHVHHFGYIKTEHALNGICSNSDCNMQLLKQLSYSVTGLLLSVYYKTFFL